MKRCVKFAGRFLALAALAMLAFGNVAAKRKKTAENASSGPPPPKFDVPIPIGHGGKKFVVPYFNDAGKLQMRLYVEVAERVDNEHLSMSIAKVETYSADGTIEMTVEFPNGVLDLNTRILTTHSPVTVRRSDFEITGDTAEFNTQTKQGKFIGKVRMLIFNREEIGPKGPAS